MIISEEKLEFHTIREMLAGHALSQQAKARLLALQPTLNEGECRRRMAETTAARSMLDALGTPPLTAMQDIDKIMTLCKTGAMLLPEQLTGVEQFLTACRRMRDYLAKGTHIDAAVAAYGESFHLLPELSEEIIRCIRAGRVDSEASPALRDIRRRIDNLSSQIQSQLAALLQSKKQFLSDGAVVQRNGRFVLPVRREHKGKISGSVVDTSGTGGTVFIEPSAVARLQEQLSTQYIEEENEVRIILYTLSALVDGHAREISINREAMETLDALFARGKLSAAMQAGPVQIGTGRVLSIIRGRHPLLDPAQCVPLDFHMGGAVRGVVVTGPNTGGKTVALKTVGLLSLMAQSGLHVTAAPESLLCMHNAYLCDVGDGQSISENLSTFSSHMTNIICILANATEESLVLLDELGSGTDPAEGMGIAIAVLEALRQSGCMLVATTHYPEVKYYAEEAEGLLNARMEFDRESLRPTYRLELGKSGESCALYIAQKLGLPADILAHARQAAYNGAYSDQMGQAQAKTVFPTSADKTDGTTKQAPSPAASPVAPPPADKQASPAAAQSGKMPAIQKTAPPAPANPAARFAFGDSVLVNPGGEKGVVFHTANDKGEVGVQIKGEKRWVPHKRIELLVSAAELYPPDYDFAVVFDTVANRKARHKMDKRHVEGLVVEQGEEWGE